MYESEKEFGGFHGISTRLLAEEGAKINIYKIQMLGDKFIHFDDIGGACFKGGSIGVTTLELGAEKTWTGCLVNLVEKDAELISNMGYLVRYNNFLDVNYIADQRGKNTNSVMHAKGVLMDSATKVFRGTIDFKNGSSGSAGDEQEDTLMLSPDVRVEFYSGVVILSLITGLFFVISLVGMVASDSAATKVKENSVFVLKLSGSVNERSEEGTPFDDFLGLGDTGSMGLDDLIASIRKAKDNDDIKGIYIQGGSAGFDSPATAQQLRDALKDFKTSGKWIVAYANNYSQASYYVATVADKIYLNGQGSVDLRGLGGKSEY